MAHTPFQFPIGYIDPALSAANIAVWMGLTVTVEAWVLSVFGWVWLVVQDVWFPSMLCSYVYYSFLVLSSWNLVLSSLSIEARGPRVAYFNTVLALSIFAGCCLADTVSTYTFGGEEYVPPMNTTGCCSNCNIARANQILFFMDSPMYLVQAGVLSGYLLVQLLLAGAQMLDLEYRSVWGGAGWSIILGVLMASRCIIVFDGSTLTLVPDSVFYLLIFSQPLLTLSVVYWLFLITFVVLMICEGFPQMDILALRVVRCIQFGVVTGFCIVSGVVFGVRGMLTVPFFLYLCIMMFSSAFAVLEAFLGSLPLDEQGVGRSMAVSSSRGPPPAVTTVPDNNSYPQGGSQRSRHYIPVSVQMPTGKKGV